jgi:hypothetical protein
MEKEHEWIAEEKDNFGRSGTPYDFEGQNIAECKSSLRNLTERFQGMKKKINPKVMNMIDSVEKKEVALKNMMRLSSGTKERSKRPSAAWTSTRRRLYKRRGRRLMVTLDRSSPNSYLGALQSWIRPRARQSRMGWKSRYASERCGSRV